MQWKNTETATFAGSDGRSDGSPDFVETHVLQDRYGNTVAAFTKAVDGTVSLAIGSEDTVQEQFDSRVITKIVAFTEDATSTTHTGTVTLPAGSILHNIQVMSSVLWAGGTATMKVGDTADDDGYFTGVNLKATDLLVGEVLDTTPSTSWGGKEGAYLVAASGRRGPTSTNFAKYYAAGSNITGIVTVGTPASTAGRTFMVVSYSVGELVAAVAA